MTIPTTKVKHLNSWPFVWAGIGSRDTPKTVLGVMQRIGFHLAHEHNSRLRSGGARGADSAFAEGYKLKPSLCELYTHKDVTSQSLSHAARFHPNWGACNDYAKKLHARNSFIILGRELNDPVDLVICWTPEAKIIGGTGQGLRIAEYHKIPIWNLAKLWCIQKLEDEGIITSDDAELLLWAGGYTLIGLIGDSEESS